MVLLLLVSLAFALAALLGAPGNLLLGFACGICALVPAWLVVFLACRLARSRRAWSTEQEGRADQRSAAGTSRAGRAFADGR